MNSSDNKLVVNPRDELIQEIMVLRNKKLELKKETKLRRTIENQEWIEKGKKEAYEWAFKELVKKYFGIDEKDIKILSSNKLEDLEKLIYEVTKRKWKWKRIFYYLPAVTIVGILFVWLDVFTDFNKEFPTPRFLRLHAWYQENFGSVAKAILHEA